MLEPNWYAAKLMKLLRKNILGDGRVLANFWLDCWFIVFIFASETMCGFNTEVACYVANIFIY